MQKCALKKELLCRYLYSKQFFRQKKLLFPIEPLIFKRWLIGKSFRKSWYSEKITAARKLLFWNRNSSKNKLLWRNSCSEKTTVVANSYFEEMGRGSFSENKAVLKKLRNLREGKIIFDWNCFPREVLSPW